MNAKNLGECVSSRIVRSLAAGGRIVGALATTGCTKSEPPPPSGPSDTSTASPSPSPKGACTNVDAAVAYYYKYKEATPDQSDIAYVEMVPAGARCVVVSTKKAPVFPDAAISAYVSGGQMKIAIPETRSVPIAGKADIAVYYAAASASAPLLSHMPLAVEDLTGVARTIITANIAAPDSAAGGSPSCSGSCRAIPCDGYACCQRPPC